jgi:uncharacterized membrane protein
MKTVKLQLYDVLTKYISIIALLLIKGSMMKNPIDPALHHRKRVFEPDVIRGFACVLMAIFHFLFDLGQFQLIEFSFSNPLVQWFRYLIVTLFLTMVGYGVFQAYHRKVVLSKVGIRFAKVGGAALIISVLTYNFSQSNWIFFGILQFIAVATLITIPFARFPKIALVLGASILIAYPIAKAMIDDMCASPIYWFQFTCLTKEYMTWAEQAGFWLQLPATTLDLVRFTPWIGMVLIGIWLGSVDLFKMTLSESIRQLKTIKIMAWFGKHSLAFYLLHQAVLFPIAYGIYWVSA